MNTCLLYEPIFSFIIKKPHQLVKVLDFQISPDVQSITVYVQILDQKHIPL